MNPASYSLQRGSGADFLIQRIRIDLDPLEYCGSGSDTLKRQPREIRIRIRQSRKKSDPDTASVEFRSGSTFYPIPTIHLYL